MNTDSLNAERGARNAENHAKSKRKTMSGEWGFVAGWNGPCGLARTDNGKSGVGAALPSSRSFAATSCHRTPKSKVPGAFGEEEKEYGDRREARLTGSVVCCYEAGFDESK